MKKLIASRQVVQLSGLIIADVAVFGTTNPQQAPSYMLIVGFILFSLTAYTIFRGVLALLSLYGLPIRHKRRLLKTMTLWAAGLVALQSIGQLAFRDVLVLSVLTFLLYLYTTYAKKSRQLAEPQA